MNHDTERANMHCFTCPVCGHMILSVKAPPKGREVDAQCDPENGCGVKVTCTVEDRPVFVTYLRNSR